MQHKHKHSGDRTTRRASLDQRQVTAHSHPPVWMTHYCCTRPHFHPVSLQALLDSWHETRTDCTWKLSRGTRLHRLRFSKSLSSLSPAGGRFLWCGARIQGRTRMEGVGDLEGMCTLHAVVVLCFGCWQGLANRSTYTRFISWTGSNSTVYFLS